MTDVPADTRWWTSPRRMIRQLLMLNDTPHSVALGTAIGMFIGLTPTVGIQMLLVGALAILARPFFRFNISAGMITVYISNPLTMLPLYALFYSPGTMLLATGSHDPIDFQAGFIEHLDETGRLLRFVFIDVGWPMIVGSLLVASVIADVSWTLDCKWAPSLPDGFTFDDAEPTIPISIKSVSYTHLTLPTILLV